MRRNLSTLDRDIGQDWSRIIQEAFLHGIDCDIIQNGLLPGRNVQGIHEVSDVQNYHFQISWQPYLIPLVLYLIL